MIIVTLRRHGEGGFSSPTGLIMIQKLAHLKAPRKLIQETYLLLRRYSARPAARDAVLRPVQNSTYTGLSATQEKSKFEHASGNIEAQPMARSLVSNNMIKGRVKIVRGVVRSGPGVANADPHGYGKHFNTSVSLGRGRLCPSGVVLTKHRWISTSLTSPSRGATELVQGWSGWARM